MVFCGLNTDNHFKLEYADFPIFLDIFYLCNAALNNELSCKCPLNTSAHRFLLIFGVFVIYVLYFNMITYLAQMPVSLFMVLN